MPPGIAITREVSAALGECELTHLARVPIDVNLARAQHRQYEQALRDAGYVVERLESTDQMPDSVFVEDIAVVFDELAIVTRPGAQSRRVETPAVAGALAPHRELHVIQAPGTVDGGDVLVHECLHLKSAVTALSDDLLLVNPSWIDRQALDGFRLVEIDTDEPAA